MSDREKPHEIPGEIPSQILPHYPYFFGPLMSCVIAMDPQDIELSYDPGARIGDAGDETDQAERPVTTWIVRHDTRPKGGPLSPATFVALWNQGVRQIDGRNLTMVMDESHERIEHPFVLWHPSGFYQAVRYRRSERLFTRQMLYPI